MILVASNFCFMSIFKGNNAIKHGFFLLFLHEGVRVVKIDLGLFTFIIVLIF